ncbi:MAG: inverse autotransporter beta domain-containing protein, partial [Planctomycetaceae bacterium]|nr:inverse autotransporter beta domain-containing protein [Planctomycetaceae bacterium]
MKNVQIPGTPRRSPHPARTDSGLRPTAVRIVAPGRDRRLPLRLLSFVSATALLCGTAAAQNDFTFGRSLLGSAPTGGSAETIDVNRAGLGFAVQAGHYAGNTIGRLDSASLFGLSPYVNIGDGLLFGDSRLLYSNSGGLAWSFGAGYRHYVIEWDTIFGVNSYYDQDDLTNAQFKQWSIGAELISNSWEARGNFYSPFGETSTQTGTRVDAGSAAFVGNNISFTRINTFAEALRGFDAEIGWLMPGRISERLDLRAFGGGYFYEGNGLPGFSGWSGRIQSDLGDRLELGLKVTDDEIFHTNVMFNATVHFGGFHSQEHTQSSSIQRMAEPVRRNLNIVATTSDVALPGQIARKADGTPFTVIHVNSNDTAGPFIGTVEDPLQSLAAGLTTPGADIVFVHAGSVFNTAPENLVVLADDQNLFG